MSAVNRDFWDGHSQTHLVNWYRVEDFQAGGITLDALQRAEVGSVVGQSLLHLQCNAGLDTLSWARLGAKVTGVDASPQAIRTARTVAGQCAAPATFLYTDLYALPSHLEGTFDVVYTSEGVLCWLHDLTAWGHLIAQYLTPGGFFYILEEHPFLAMLDSAEPRLHPAHPYFRAAQADYDGATYQWYWSLAEIVTALTQAGLRIEFLHEFPYTFWQRAPYMQRNDDHWWYVPGFSWPLLFTLKASKP